MPLERPSSESSEPAEELVSETSESISEIDARIDADILKLKEDEHREADFDTEKQARAEADAKELEAVRTRLSLPNRREFLKGLVSVAALSGTGSVLESRGAYAESKEFEFTPEQLERYEKGIKEMRLSASNEKLEIMRFFVVRADGSFYWKEPQTETRSGVSTENGSGFATVTADSETSQDILREAKDGARVEILHTHPTHALTGEIDKGDPIPGMDRIPPSPADIMVNLWSVKDFGVEHYKSTVVSEAGTWEYGPVSDESGSKLLKAFESAAPALRLLEKKYDLERRVLAAYFQQRARDPVENGTKQVLTMLSSILKNGSLNKSLIRDSGPVLAGVQEILSMFGKRSDFPSGARLYLRTIQRADKEMKDALKKIAPQSDGKIGDAPEINNYQSYVDRWKNLGVKMEFKPFNTSEVKESGL